MQCARPITAKAFFSQPIRYETNLACAIFPALCQWSRISNSDWFIAEFASTVNATGIILVSVDYQTKTFRRWLGS